MRRTRRNRAGACVAAAVIAGAAGLAAGAAHGAPSPRDIALTPLGTYATGIAGGTSGETAALQGTRLYVTNSTGNSLDIVDVTDPARPVLERRVDLSPYGAGPNSVDARRGLVAVAVEASPITAPGAVVFLTPSGEFIARATVGSLPDMLTFTPDGRQVLVADEGEAPAYGPGETDPEGSVSIVATSGLTRSGGPEVRRVGFADFDAGGPRHGELPSGVRLNGPGATVAQDLEPEYIAVDEDGRTATVTLQDNNAIARIDLRAGRVVSITALGWKDHSAAGQGLDPSDRDGGISIGTWPVRGLYMPDALAAFRVRGRDYLISANEGDGRDRTGFGDEVRVGASSVVLDPAAFPDAAGLKAPAALGRLNVSRTDGLTGGVYTALYSFGARSATIWTTAGTRVWDSGDQIERRIAAEVPAAFNVSNDANVADDRSDNKGPEPEGVAVGTVRGRTYAFVGLERVGGLMVFDVSTPASPRLVQWANRRDYGLSPLAPGQDSGPEVVHFVPEKESPVRAPLVVVANEVSGTVTMYRVTQG
jgi:hypothetical protein